MKVKQDGSIIYVRRSLLWMAGSNLKSIDKLTQQKCFEADVVTMDLEDTVPAQHKAAARENVAEALRSLDFGSTERAVRINSAGTGLMEDDVAVIVPARPDFIRLPKIYDANEVWLLDRLMTKAEKEAGLDEGSTSIVVHIENPRALLVCSDILRASRRVVGIVLSGEDYRESMQARRSNEPPAWEMIYGRGKVIVEARAAGAQAFDTVYMDTENSKGYRAEAEVVRTMGFDGKNCLTGDQVAIANEVFSPSREDIDFAKRAVDAYDEATAGESSEAEHGLTSGMLPYVDGTLIGPPWPWWREGRLLSPVLSVCCRLQAPGEIGDEPDARWPKPCRAQKGNREVKMNIAGHLSRAGTVWPHRPAVAVGAAVFLDYGSLAARTACLAGALRTRFGLRSGERVLLAMGNCPQYLEILYACWHAGLVAVPVNAKLHSEEFSYLIEDSGAALCFVNEACLGAIGEARTASLKAVIEVGGSEYDTLLKSEPIDIVPRSLADSAWLFYTSGTTGRPKGADLSHRSLLAMSFCYFADVDPQSPWRALIHAAPMSHGSGLYIIPHVVQASCHVVPESGVFDPGEIFALIERWPAASMFAAPTMVTRLVEHPSDRSNENLKSLIYGGGPMYVEDCLAALDRFGPKLTQLYGQGESPMSITALNAELHADRDHPCWLERLASVGVVQSGVEVRIADSNDAPVPVGEIGEVLVRGDTLMNGYWQNPEASAETLRGGWLHTGDLGSIDDDGFITLRDRSKDVIISGGTNIYPREVEEVLLIHPAVVEVSVIGQPDRKWGESVLAVVVCREGTSVREEDLDRLCLSRMARFKRPKHYVFLENLPKSPVGKVLKTELRSRFRDSFPAASNRRDSG